MRSEARATLALATLALASAQGRARAAQAPAGFTPVKGAVVIPVDSTVHAVNGRLSLTSVATASAAGRTQKTQRAEFYDGIFQIRQARALRPFTDIAVRSENFKQVCGAKAKGASAIGARSRRVSRLWGNGRGRFRTVGRNSAATVRGTIWLTEERCEGTLTRVTRGVVSVRDLRAKRTVVVRAGRSYLARAIRATVKARKR